MFAPDGRLLAEHDGATGSLIREYIWLDDMPLALVAGSVSSPSYYYVHTGQIGEPLIVTDASKAKVWDAAVDPWGKPTMLATPTQTVSLRLPGQWNASESGLHQNWMRDYDPTTGRYIEADPLGIEAGANLYPYVDSNPLNLVDRKGKFGTPQTAAAGAIIFGLADFGWQLYHYDWDWHCVDYWEVGKAALIGAGVGGIGRFLIGRFGGQILGFGGKTIPYGVAAQEVSSEALAARTAVQEGATLYRGGTLGVSAGPEGQFWSLESPLNPGYAERYGIPAENMNFDFIESGTLDPGSNFITRAAPGIGNNGGGARCHSLWRRYSERVYNALKVSSGEGRFMTILSNKDLYEKVRRTILALQNSGMEQEAARLENAMKISSMPGEILGEIRLVLERIDTSVLAEQITFEIGSEIAYINSVLG